MVATMIAISTIGVTVAITEKLLFDEDEHAKQVVRTAGYIGAGLLVINCVVKVIKEIKSLGL